MPAEESKPVDPVVNEVDAEIKDKQAAVESDGEEEDEEPVAGDASAAGGASAASGKKKKKSKRKKVKEVLTGKSGDAEADLKKAIGGLTPQQLQELMSLNPALAGELSQASGSANPSPDQIAELLKKMNLQDIMTGLAAAGKNVKDMASYKFWQTQPVPKFGEDDKTVEEGPLRIQTVDEVSKEPAPLVAGFEWVTMDLTNDDEIKEVYELLNGHYVEDDEAMFRFNYGPGILKWAMMPPGWAKHYHVGVRASQSRKLVAFISAIPVRVRVRNNVITCSEVNFLCVHKKLRGKRLAPVLIKEITRISNQHEIWQGLFTAGIVLPKPISTCRYYHRSLNWQKLYECSFVHLPHGSKPQYQIRKYTVPDHTSTKGLREMKPADIEAVINLMDRYMKRFDIAPEMSKEEATHWFCPTVEPGQDQYIWSYVVEDSDKNITDFFSFYCIESSAINNPKHDVIRVAYLFYYATDAALKEPSDKAALKTRLNDLMHDALILAKLAKFDVFNALSLMDNGLFLEQQKFGAGDGQLHYYLFNYRANPIAGGVDKKNQLDENHLSGVGLVLP
ncbi:glycylpeptide n-tetradecanoyltransferase [Trichoderma arundinaceum]|uniref:Glycylpeptide N-tetradecanoyltransferase n=1 Tax=Trichoderma arundinaceum TaxID=490622 RepID=A0A395NS17_TRIAR|nr:glycylpeptide n-tetradecanoyltransferase [Trichoderma arundinaceum]